MKIPSSCTDLKAKGVRGCGGGQDKKSADTSVVLGLPVENLYAQVQTRPATEHGQPHPLCPGIALCSRSACISDTDPFLTEWAAKQQCGRQLHEAWLGTWEPWVEESGWGEQYCRLPGEGSRNKARSQHWPSPFAHAAQL